jgi:hypothetical protein
MLVRKAGLGEMASTHSTIERLPMEVRRAIIKRMDADTMLNFICTSKWIYVSFVFSLGIQNEPGAVTTIEHLPMEICLGIMQFMDAKTLVNFICTSRRLYNSFLAYSGKVSQAVIENETGADSVIERLPMELRHALMQSMDVATLINFICTSKTLYRSFLVSPNIISHAAIQNEIGADLLPLAAARYQAECDHDDIVAAGYATYEERSIKFIEDNISLQGLTLMTPPAKFTLRMASDLSNFHATVIYMSDKHVEYSSEDVMDSTGAITDMMEVYPLTPAEELRFIKAFYIHELAMRVIPWEALQHRRAFDRPFATFWERFAPWECSQVNQLEAWLFSLLKDCKLHCPGSSQPSTKHSKLMTH